MKHLTLRQAREAKRPKWTQKMLEEKSGVPQSRISDIENGVTSDPNNSTVQALETALGLARGTLVFGDAAAKVA